jgi:hypothetical protein
MAGQRRGAATPDRSGFCTKTWDKTNGRAAVPDVFALRGSIKDVAGCCVLEAFKIPGPRSLLFTNPFSVP